MEIKVGNKGTEILYSSNSRAFGAKKKQVEQVVTLLEGNNKSARKAIPRDAAKPADSTLWFLTFEINSSVRTGSREEINRYLGMPLVGSRTSHEFLLSNKNTVDLALTNEGGGEWHLALAMVGRTVIYAVIMALLLGLVALVAKLLASCEDEQRATPRERAASETSRLLAKEADSDNYGTCTEEEEDLEVGKCSSSNGSSEDLYDGKICVICYDERRNCFFIPCGHCATCYVCARRIKDEESKTCPVCRRYIRKIKKLFV